MRNIILTLFVLLFATCFANAQTSVFTYQGKLTDTSAAANGQYDLTFRLFDAASDGTQIGTDFFADNVPVSGGIFTVNLNFGASSFSNGAARFLEISVRTGTSNGAFTTLAPRQQITSAPFAIQTLKAASADALSSSCNLCVTDAQIQSLAGNKLSGVISGNGSGLMNLNGGNIASGSVTSSQLSSEILPNTTAYKQLGSLRWDLLKGQGVFSTGNSPWGVAFDGANVWTANFNASTVTKLRVSDGANLGTFPVGSNPRVVAFDGANIWAVNINSNNVTKLRASDGANLGSFAVGNAPQGIAFDGANMWITNTNSNNVTKLRASDGANLGTFPVGTNPRLIAFDGANMWIANYNSDNVTKLRASDGTNLGTFPVGNNPHGVAFDGANIWVTNSNASNVTKLRAADGVNIGTFTTASYPTAIAFDGANMWITSFNTFNVTKLRAVDGANLGNFTINSSSIGIAFDGANMWVTGFDANNVTRMPPAFPQ